MRTNIIFVFMVSIDVNNAIGALLIRCVQSNS